MSSPALIDPAWGKRPGDCHGDEGQKKILAGLEVQQKERQAALDHAAQNADDSDLFETLLDCLGGGVFHAGLKALLRDVLETTEGEDVKVDPRFARAIRNMAVNYFGDTHE